MLNIDYNLVEQCKDFIKKCEGYRAQCYNCGDGNRTIGYGHLVKKGEFFAQPITQRQADDLLTKDVLLNLNTIHSYVRVPLTDNQIIALTSLIFNIGKSAFVTSSLLKALNKRDYKQAGILFTDWVYVKGRYVVGLNTRRTVEKTLFNTPDQTNDVPIFVRTSANVQPIVEAPKGIKSYIALFFNNLRNWGNVQGKHVL